MSTLFDKSKVLVEEVSNNWQLRNLREVVSKLSATEPRSPWRCLRAQFREGSKVGALSHSPLSLTHVALFIGLLKICCCLKMFLSQ